MMQPQELRIGNWITVMGSIPTQVTAYHLYMMTTNVPINPEEEADYKEMTNPVELNEEWLLKAGFEKPGSFLMLVISDEEDIKLRSSLQIGFPGCGYVQVCRAGINAYTAKIEYVHQLQNLYFALTGKELELTPSTV